MTPAREIPPRVRRLAVAGAALAVLGLTAPATPAWSAEPAVTLPGARAPLGMAVDHARNRYWLLTARSGVLTLHAYTGDGQDEGSMTSRDRLTDAQGLAFVDGVAYVGDIGGRRSEVRVYGVTEPWPGTEINLAPALTLTYPDGAHDAAALFVDANHRVGVVTRGDAPGIYLAPQGSGLGQSAALERVADAPADITDATVLVDGRVVLRTGSLLIAMNPAGWGTLGQAEVGVEETGHALAEAITPGRIMTGLSAENALSVSDVPGPAPADATAEPTREPAGPATSPEPSEQEATRSFPQTGTTAAIVAALVASALAAVVVLLRR